MNRTGGRYQPSSGAGGDWLGSHGATVMATSRRLLTGYVATDRRDRTGAFKRSAGGGRQ